MEWYESTTNIAIASLAGILTISLAILGLIQLRSRDVANQSELNREDYGDEDDLVVIDDATSDSENRSTSIDDDAANTSDVID